MVGEETEEFIFRDFSFREWQNNGNMGTNAREIDLLKKMLPRVMNECCTEKQKIYITHYFVDRLTLLEIGEMYGVGKSTVSRSIHSGLRNVYKTIRFLSPYFANIQMADERLNKARRNRKTNREMHNKKGDSNVTV